MQTLHSDCDFLQIILPLRTRVLWSHPIHMLLMAWHVPIKHMSPSHCTLRNLAYGSQHLRIVQSAIQHESLLKCNRLNISWHNIASNGIRMLFYFMDLHLSLINICPSLPAPLENLVRHSRWYSRFWKTDFIRFLIHTWKRKHIAKIFWISALFWCGSKWILWHRLKVFTT